MMYEQVAGNCVTAVIAGGFANSPTYIQEEDPDDVPPVKPPRRHHLKKQLSKHEPSEVRKCQKMITGNGDTCIDVDHVHLENCRNYKNKHASIGTQTSPLVPYRLRFWPKGSRDVKCDPSESGCSKVQLKCCCRTFSQLLLSQIGLTVVLIIWALAGAAGFFYTEGPREEKQSEDLDHLQQNLSSELASHLLDLQPTSNSTEIFEDVVRAYLLTHERSLLEAVSAGYGEGGGGSIWTYPGCILFAVSLLTTLGFGAPVPRTPLGRGAAVLFAAVGIPLHFLLILNVGNLAAIKLQLSVYRCSSKIPSPADGMLPHPTWLKWFPLFAVAAYYLLGVIVFGVARLRDPTDCLMFPLDFTAAGGVAKTPGYLRIVYALYLEFAVMLASVVVSLLQVSASRGIINLGLRLGLLTNN